MLEAITFEIQSQTIEQTDQTNVFFKSFFINWVIHLTELLLVIGDYSHLYNMFKCLHVERFSLFAEELCQSLCEIFMKSFEKLRL